MTRPYELVRDYDGYWFTRYMEDDMPDPYACSVCDRHITDLNNCWIQVKGWTRKRSQGGANQIALSVPQGVLMCNACMSEQQAGEVPGQQTLA